MTPRRLSSAFLFALILAATLSGYTLFPSEAAQPVRTESKSPSVAQAEEAVRNAEKKFATANLAAEDAKDRAEAAKSEADKLEERARRNGVDTSDPNSQTAKLRVVQKQAEEALKRADSAVETAKRELDTARANFEATRNGPKPAATATTAPTPDGDGDWMDFIAAWFLPIGGVLTAMLVLGGLFCWMWLKIEAASTRNEELIRPLAKKQDAILLEMDSAASHVKDLKQRLHALQEDTFRLERTVKELHRERILYAQPDEVSSGMRAAPVSYAPPAAEPEALEFPVAADNFLSRFGGRQQQVVKADWLRGILVKDPDGHGTFVLVRDGSVHGGGLYIIPRITRFQAAEDFYNHYEQFYDCVRPAAGEVWVSQPAVADSVDGGWRLLEKGELEVRT